MVSAIYRGFRRLFFRLGYPLFYAIHTYLQLVMQLDESTFHDGMLIENIDMLGNEEGYSIHFAKDVLESFAKKLCMNLHVEISGEGDMHHYLEAVFKALGIAMDKATAVDPRREGAVPSSKGIL